MKQSSTATDMLGLPCLLGRLAQSCMPAVATVVLAGLLGQTLLAKSPTPHPFHISIAEAEFNPQSERFEVSLKVHANDLEQSLRLMTGEKLDVEKDDIGEAVENFIDRFFYLLPAKVAKQIEERSLDAAGDANADEAQEFARSKCKFAGKELDTTWIWLYFELELPETDAPLAVVDAIFLDRIEKQINTLTFRVGKQKHALKLTKKNPWAEIPWIDEQLAKQ